MKVQSFGATRGLLLYVYCLLCTVVPASAQTVRPLIAELGNPAKGRVEYINDGLTPLNVVLEVRSFAVSETGQISYRSLDPAIRLRLSTTSFRIQPQQHYYVFYEATTNVAPQWFVIYAAFSGFPFRTQQGMNVRLELPHTVYLLPRKTVDKTEVCVRAEFHSEVNSVLVEVENTGDNFGRVLQTFLAYPRKKKEEAPGFPIFPHSRRILQIPLEQKAASADPPEAVVLQLQNFKIEEKLQRKAP